MARNSVRVERFPDGTPCRFSSIGSYPIFYLSNADDVLCPDCAGKEEDANRERGQSGLAACDANWEDPSLYCDECSERIESAYAEDEAAQIRDGEVCDECKATTPDGFGMGPEHADWCSMHSDKPDPMVK